MCCARATDGSASRQAGWLPCGNLPQAGGPETTTGAHKINNSLGQALLCLRMNKRRIIAETGAGQHGVATVGMQAVLKMTHRNSGEAS